MGGTPNLGMEDDLAGQSFKALRATVFLRSPPESESQEDHPEADQLSAIPHPTIGHRPSCDVRQPLGSNVFDVYFVEDNPGRSVTPGC